MIAEPNAELIRRSRQAQAPGKGARRSPQEHLSGVRPGFGRAADTARRRPRQSKDLRDNERARSAEQLFNEPAWTRMPSLLPYHRDWPTRSNESSNGVSSPPSGIRSRRVTAHNVRYVLGFGLAGAIIALMVLYLFYFAVISVEVDPP